MRAETTCELFSFCPCRPLAVRSTRQGKPCTSRAIFITYKLREGASQEVAIPCDLSTAGPRQWTQQWTFRPPPHQHCPSHGQPKSNHTTQNLAIQTHPWLQTTKSNSANDAITLTTWCRTLTSLFLHHHHVSFFVPIRLPVVWLRQRRNWMLWRWPPSLLPWPLLHLVLSSRLLW
jgi:hypothetical protein